MSHYTIYLVVLLGVVILLIKGFHIMLRIAVVVILIGGAYLLLHHTTPSAIQNTVAHCVQSYQNCLHTG
jgi:hypothetical protein